MDNIESEKKLIHFSSIIAEKCLDNENEPGLNEIIENIVSLDSISEEASIDEQEATDLRIDPEGPNDGVESALTVETVEVLKSIAVKIINLLKSSNNSKTHKDLLKITRCIWPLYSRDVRTNLIGFDLQEYCDYFQNMSTEDREKLAKQLFDEWGIGE